MKGEFGNADNGIAVKAALKGLNWHDQMEMARAMRKEKSQREMVCDDTPTDDKLQPIFKQLKRTRANATAEAKAKTNRSTRADPSAVECRPVEAEHRGVRLEAAITGNITGPKSDEHHKSSSDRAEAQPKRLKTPTTTQDETCGISDESEGALVLVSRIMDGEVLDEEPDREPNAIVLHPFPETNTRWRLAIGFGFGVGLGIGLSVLIGIALLGSMLGLKDNAITPTVSEASRSNIGGVKAVDDQASVPDDGATGSMPLTQMTASVAVPLVGSTPPALVPFDSAGTVTWAIGKTVEIRTYEEPAPANLRLLAVPALPEKPPIVPVQAPRSRQSPTDVRPPASIAILQPPDDAGLSGAERLSAVLNAPAKLPGEKVDSAATNLRKTGLSLRSVNRVNFRVGSDHIRFFHPDDAALAASVASFMGADVRDFTSFRPLPPAGSIEVYLAGNGLPTKRKAVATTEPVAALQSLRQSILRTFKP